MSRTEDLDLLKDALLSRPRAESPTPDCLGDDAVAALAEGALDGAERAAAVAHLAQCPQCLSAVASVARALADSTLTRAVAAAQGGTRRRFYRIAVPLAAAALLVLVFSPRRTEDAGSAHRAPTITAAAAPEPRSPLGTVATARTLRWGAVSGADRYRVTLFDAVGGIVYETQVADTVVVLPDSIVVTVGRRHLWQVEARTGFDRWTASPLVEFTVSPGAVR